MNNGPDFHIHCHECGALVRDIEIESHQALKCRRCGNIVKTHRRRESYQAACALALAGLLLLVLANTYPIMQFGVAGNVQSNEISTGIRVLFRQGYWPVALLVSLCAQVAPLVYFAGVAYVAAACSVPYRLPAERKVLAVACLAQPWSLLPVFAVACLVSAVKLDLIGHVDWKSGVWFIAVLAVNAVILGSLFDSADAGRILREKGAT